MKGKIPATSLLKLESEESQWRILARGIINELKTSALVERLPGSTVRIQLVIKKIIPPESSQRITICHTETNFGEQVAAGLSRSREFLSDYLGKSAWLFIGYIDGEERTPIIITHYESVNITIYTQKLKAEEADKFFPMLPSAPSQN